MRSHEPGADDGANPNGPWGFAHREGMTGPAAEQVAGSPSVEAVVLVVDGPPAEQVRMPAQFAALVWTWLREPDCGEAWRLFRELPDGSELSQT